MDAERGRKRLITIWVDEKQLEKLGLLSDKTRVPKSVYIREGVDFILNKYADHIKNKRKK